MGSTEMLLDGVSYVDRFGGGISRVQPGLDTIQEYRIETAGSGAQYDRPATIELVTRSGTNALPRRVFRDHPEQWRRPGCARAPGREHAGQVDPQRVRRMGRRSDRQKQDLLVLQPGISPAARAEFSRKPLFPPRPCGTAISATPMDTSGNPNHDLRSVHRQVRTEPGSAFPGNIIPPNRLNPKVIDVFKSVSPLPNGPNAGGNPWMESNFQTFYPRDHEYPNNDLQGRSGLLAKDSSVRPLHAVQTGKCSLRRPVRISAARGCKWHRHGSQDTIVHSVMARWTHVFTPDASERIPGIRPAFEQLQRNTRGRDQLGFESSGCRILSAPKAGHGMHRRRPTCSITAAGTETTTRRSS